MHTKKYIFSLSNTLCKHGAHVSAEGIFDVSALRGALVDAMPGLCGLCAGSLWLVRGLRRALAARAMAYSAALVYRD